MFTQPFIRAQIKVNIKAPRHWPLCGEFTGDRWIPRINGQLRGKCFHLMTSSCTSRQFYCVVLSRSYAVYSWSIQVIYSSILQGLLRCMHCCIQHVWNMNTLFLTTSLLILRLHYSCIQRSIFMLLKLKAIMDILSEVWYFLRHDFTKKWQARTRRFHPISFNVIWKQSIFLLM